MGHGHDTTGQGPTLRAIGEGLRAILAECGATRGAYWVGEDSIGLLGLGPHLSGHYTRAEAARVLRAGGRILVDPGYSGRLVDGGRSVEVELGPDSQVRRVGQ